MTESKISKRLSKLLQCSVCSGTFKKPKMLPCQHNFCLEPCLIGLADYENDEVQCPLCEKTYAISDEGIRGFANNVMLERLLEINKPIETTKFDIYVKFSNGETLTIAGEYLNHFSICSFYRAVVILLNRVLHY